MVLPVVNIESQWVRCGLLLLKILVVLGTRQTEIDCSLLTVSLIAATCEKGRQELSQENRQAGYLQKGQPYQQPEYDLEESADQ